MVCCLGWVSFKKKRGVLKGLPREKEDLTHTGRRSLINSKITYDAFPSLSNGLSLGRDLTLVQKTIIDTLHNEGQAKKGHC